jgi:hypothetical protein
LKIVLQSHDRFDDFAEFDRSDNRITILSKTREPGKWTGYSQGWYAKINENDALLFSENHELYFSYAGTTYPIQNNVYARIQDHGAERNFTLTRDARPIFSIQYPVPKPVVPSEFDMTDTAPEDFDFLLFVKNILEDPTRRKFAMGIALA